ncbi:hypothetical protein CGCS363_v009995 [Colletotrichum siamense]|uniref:uncharacterized protein n=1 Tax=Colletotrichum siamense TaxID=690259 RepID=UPI001873311E|nr:uncharacterized protein CGCS363_v009995 [Colletotrichum siamense]KAF5494731.1 hypothetical protein CGCS363_v009995 [Colletotrichum siamense]
MDEEQSLLMRIPAEIRMMIYEHLLDDGGEKKLAIRNKAMHQLFAGNLGTYNRSKYRVMQRSFQRTCFETTYHLAAKTKMHTAIMAVNQQAHRETSHMLYGLHNFDFDGDIEAVVPFLQDLTPRSRAMIGEVTIRKASPLHFTDSDRSDWSNMCKYLRRLDKIIPKLRVVVDGGKPAENAWEGGRQLEVSDLRLLSLIKHESMEWIADLKTVEGLTELEVVPHMRYLGAPTTSTALLFAAFSASIDTALVDFLREDCNLPAKASTSA